MRAHSASLSLLHQPTESEHWREGQSERKTLPYFSVPDRHEVSVWCESREGPKAGGAVAVLWGSMEAGLNTYIDSGVVFKACYTRLLPGLTQL